MLYHLYILSGAWCRPSPFWIPIAYDIFFLNLVWGSAGVACSHVGSTKSHKTWRSTKDDWRENYHNPQMGVWYDWEYQKSTPVDCWLVESKTKVNYLRWYTNREVVRLHLIGWHRPDTVWIVHTLQAYWPDSQDQSLERYITNIYASKSSRSSR